MRPRPAQVLDANGDPVIAAVTDPRVPPDGSISADGTVTEVAGTVGPSAAAATTDYVNVFMEVSDDGDYEVPFPSVPLVHLSASRK